MDARYSNEWPSIRAAVLERDNHKCVYCGRQDKLHVHHIRPLTRHGNNEQYNLMTLCSECHRKEHADIKENGLCCIPSPEYEAHRMFLTDIDAVMRMERKLKAEGLTPTFAVIGMFYSGGRG